MFHSLKKYDESFYRNPKNKYSLRSVSRNTLNLKISNIFRFHFTKYLNFSNKFGTILISHWKPYNFFCHIAKVEGTNKLKRRSVKDHATKDATPRTLLTWRSNENEKCHLSSNLVRFLTPFSVSTNSVDHCKGCYHISLMSEIFLNESS